MDTQLFITLKVDTKELDEALEKANRLVELLQEVATVSDNAKASPELTERAIETNRADTSPATLTYADGRERSASDNDTPA